LEAGDNDQSQMGRRYSVVECARCKLWYTNPRPTAESIGKFYADDYRPHQSPKSASLKTSLFRRLQALAMGRPCLERHYLPLHGKGRLLDFGCGGGEFLLRMRKQGWMVRALDSSEKVIGHLRGKYGLRGHVGTLPHPDLAPESFDVITMWASLEHVHQPLDVLRSAYKLLAPGGRLYLQVHNIDNWDRSLFGPHWFSLDLPRHLTHFSEETLAKTLEVAGFRVASMRKISHPSSTRKSLTIAKKAGSISLGKRLLGLKPVYMLRSWMAYLAGAGDHLFAFAERPK
jgi:2-polyprenyl-3-methyl-5-hydroxy-6-metoxy-1,4-benzoquinol methylase